MADVIQDVRMRSFVHAKVSNEFGLSIAQVAEKAKGYGRFKAWLNSDTTKIVEVLNRVKANGVSPAFFAAYEKTEGYNSQWGWLNHTSVNGTYLNDAGTVSNWIVTQSKNTTDKPAWIDFANYKDFVPSEVKTAGNADFENMVLGSIGKVVIAGTAAATWEVYYPNGLKATYNGIQDYGAPINNMMDSIESWGGVLSGEGTPTDPPPDTEPIKPDVTVDLKGISDFFDQFKEDLMETLKKMLTGDMFDYGNSGTLGNSYITIITQLKNMYKLRTTAEFEKVLNDFVDEATTELGGVIDGIKPVVTYPEPEDEEPPVQADEKPLWPTTTGLIITSPHGWRLHPIENIQKYHAGIDIGGNGVTHPIYATQSGTVIRNGEWGSGGHSVALKHSGDTYFSQYLHLHVPSPLPVGTVVKKGDRIGTMGTSGGSTGIHLHFEVVLSEDKFSSDDTVNPEDYLKMNF